MTNPAAPNRPPVQRRARGGSLAALAALLALALAAPAGAQSALTEPAPGRGDASPAVPAPADPSPAEVPRAPAEPSQAEPRDEAATDGQTDLPATAIIRELAPTAREDFGATFRVDSPTGPVLVDVSYSVDLTIFFAYDSARILPEALAQMDALGEALRSPELLPHAFLIAGHTDAAGSSAYNLDLSYARALAVADYLVAYHGIVPARLVPHGWGEEYLRLPSDPGSGVNRRVEVSLIVPEESSFRPRTFRVPGQGIVHPATHRGRTWDHAWSLTRHPTWTRPAGSGLVDPRWRLAPDALDDFHATPTRLGL